MPAKSLIGPVCGLAECYISSVRIGLILCGKRVTVHMPVCKAFVTTFMYTRAF